MNINDFHTKGYCIIDNFLPKDTAQSIFNKFKNQKIWRQVDQERRHYGKDGPFYSTSDFLPNEDEIYYQKTKRADILEKNEEWRNIYKSIFLSKIEKEFNSKVLKDTTYILKYKEGDFSRTHTDDLRGEVNRVDIGILYYLCDRWVWDWGGLLLIGKTTESEEMKAILPKHNRLILLNHQKRCPHSVTPVLKFAKNERYCVASFLSCDRKMINSDLR